MLFWGGRWGLLGLGYLFKTRVVTYRAGELGSVVMRGVMVARG